MKRFYFLLLISLILTTSYAHSRSARYYRVWQGFKRPSLSASEFLDELPQFMEDTVDLYEGRALNQYLVAIPPRDKPSFIPDEFALVALYSESLYQEIRSTPEGRAYSARHWDVFNKRNSKSSKFHNFYQERVRTLINNHAYDLFGRAVDWERGESVFYLGIRKRTISTSKFLKRIYRHIKMVKSSFSKKGLKGYIIIANKNYLACYQSWRSKSDESQAYERIRELRSEFLNDLMVNKARRYSPSQVRPANFIKTIY